LNPTEQLLREAKSGAIPVEEAMEKYREEILEKLSPVKVYFPLVGHKPCTLVRIASA
jgi:hypothetical protein